MEVGDWEPCDSKDTRVTDVSETTEEPKNSHMGITVFSHQLKHIYTNTHGMDSKQEELEFIVRLRRNMVG